MIKKLELMVFKEDSYLYFKFTVNKWVPRFCARSQRHFSDLTSNSQRISQTCLTHWDKFIIHLEI